MRPLLIPLFSLLLAACGDPVERCQGNIEVECVSADECFCATGEFEGETCVELTNSTDPDACENLCCGAMDVYGPGSVLQGTAE